MGDTVYTVTLERLEKSRGPRRMSRWALLSRCTLPVGRPGLPGFQQWGQVSPEAPLEVSHYHTGFRVQSRHPRGTDRATSTSLGSTPAVSGPWADRCLGIPWVGCEVQGVPRHPGSQECEQQRDRPREGGC